MLRSPKTIDQNLLWKQPPEHAPFYHYIMTTERGEQKIVEDNALLKKEINFPKGDDSQQIGKVIDKKQVEYGNIIVQRDDNPSLQIHDYIIQ